MQVNPLSKVFQTNGGRWFLAAAILFSVVFYLVAVVPGRSDLRSKRMNIAVRAIGHELLRRSGDFTTVIPPVVEKSPGVLMLEFRNEFAFQPDSLAAIVQRHLGPTGFSDYAVTVHSCDQPAIVYGFDHPAGGNSFIPCRGREHPKACYNVEIAFADFPDSKLSFASIALIVTGCISTLGLVLTGINRTSRKPSPLPVQNDQKQNGHDAILLGKFTFNTILQTLRIGEEVIPLTDKECKILTMLHRNIGVLTPREQLIQKIWTEEGVITGRSLDMFISKLRKKLVLDSDIRITAIHGKGYRLDIGTDHTA